MGLKKPFWKKSKRKGLYKNQIGLLGCWLVLSMRRVGRRKTGTEKFEIMVLVSRSSQREPYHIGKGIDLSRFPAQYRDVISRQTCSHLYTLGYVHM